MVTVVGTMNFAIRQEEKKDEKRGRKVSDRARECCRIIKEQGTVELMELANMMGLSYGCTKSAVTSATTLDGSMIYEEIDEGHTYLGWMKR